MSPCVLPIRYSDRQIDEALVNVHNEEGSGTRMGRRERREGGERGEREELQEIRIE